MESFESPSLPEKKDEENFLLLQTEKGEKDDFIPFGNSGVLHESKREAENILKEAQEKATLLEREAYEKGFAQGEKDGFELGGKKAKKVIQNIENLLNEMSMLKKQILRLYEREVLELIFTIAKKIIHDRINSDGEVVKHTILNALYLATEKSAVTLRINPEDFDYVEKLRPAFFSEFKGLKSIAVTPDPSITRGGCFLETPYGNVDAKIETQLEKIHECLKGTFAEHGDE